MRQHILDRYGRPTQQSMTVDPADYSALNLTRPMLGIIVSVNPADSTVNRSAYQTADYRGYFATASVLIVRDGRDTYIPVDNVIITPDSASGLDSYYERLPRGCSGNITGTALSSVNGQTSVFDLDGDWCVVSWLGGSFDRPFILRWWPHPRNPHDPSTSGRPSPLNPSEGSTLDQRGRFFQRVNGVEYVVTQRGDVYMSTYRANSSLSYGSDLSPDQGRFRRTLDADTGGSVKLWVKQSQALELDWNDPLDGIGVHDIQDDQLPQTNPGGHNTSSAQKDNTFCKIEKDRVVVQTSDQIKLYSKNRLLLNSDGDTKLTIGGDHTADVSGSHNVTATQDVNLSADQTVDIVGQNVQLSSNASSVGGVASIVIVPDGIILGTGELGGVVGGTNLLTAIDALSAAVTAAQSSATIENEYASALALAFANFALAAQSAVSPTTTVG